MNDTTNSSIIADDEDAEDGRAASQFEYYFLIL